jgi:hypothetical protein
MSQRTKDIRSDADRLSLDYLIAECIWDPSINEDGDGETLHAELLRHLAREAQSYVRWCESNGYRSMNNSNFGMAVKQTFSSVKRGQRRLGNRRISIYQGLSVMEGSEVASETNESVSAVSAGRGDFPMWR